VSAGTEARPTDRGKAYIPRHKGGVDLATGLYTREDEDLVVFDTLPLILRRTYLAGDHISRQFGVGGTHPGEWYLIGDGATFQWASLILATGGRIRFTRVSPGTTAIDGVFEHRVTPTEFFGSRITWDPDGWAMRFANGSDALFKRCPPRTTELCSILRMRDAEGHQIRYVRDPSGLLLAMQGDSQRIDFTYDSKRRIILASDSQNHSVKYAYDDRGRLTQVSGSDGSMRVYTYNDRDEMLTIDEPGWTIENEFDSSGRVVGQRTQFHNPEELYTFRFDYTLRDGSIVQTDVIQNGEHTRHTFNQNHYALSETFDPEGPMPVSIHYDRDTTTNVVRAVSVRCASRAGPVSLTVPTDPGSKRAMGRAVAARACR
jgi:YD repeat-containing protein